MNLVDRNLCCGCKSCVQTCPIGCIRFVPDNEGFLYPIIDADSCVNCGKCLSVCPVENPLKSESLKICYAAKNPNKDEIIKSSSGGVFISLAKKILNARGIVCGAEFEVETCRVKHGLVSEYLDLLPLCGSKYVQSEIDQFKQIEQELKKGRVVLFVGTPCQVAALKKFVSKDYDNLYTMDFICHGVASPLIWNKYLDELGVDRLSIKRISFRDKTESWKKYRMIIETDKGKVVDDVHYNNPYMKAFLNSFDIRPSCHNCKYKANNSGSDLTIGDYWRVRSQMPHFYDSDGVSVAIVNSEKGKHVFEQLEVEKNPVEYENVVASNASMTKTTSANSQRSVFWDNIDAGNGFCETINDMVPNQAERKTIKELLGDCLFLLRRHL